MPGKQYVVGDIHGAWKALMECFEKASFDYEADGLICLGDACDGWPDVKKVLDELLKIKNLVYVLGNHDKWALNWFLTRQAPAIWIEQGGNATVDSYCGMVPESHIQIFSRAYRYYKLGNKIFVHGGFNPDIPIGNQDENILLWDRALLHRAINSHQENTKINITGFEEVYIGHTPTINFGTLKPLQVCEVIDMDTGAGWPGGVLTMMDIDSGAIVQSSPVHSLYPDYSGRF
jgi:serine/threonine protein phosphatase 1